MTGQSTKNTSNTVEPQSSNDQREEDLPNASNDRREIAELFPNLELGEVFTEYAYLSSEALVELIISKREQIPKKPSIFDRMLLRACSFVASVAHRWPSFLGGRLLDRVAVSLECSTSPRKRGVKETMECSVCWEQVAVAEMCFCDALVRNVFAEDPDKENTWTTSSSQCSSGEVHTFCRNCLEAHATAAAEEMPMARGGLGLRCMVPDCENPITFQELSAFVPTELTQKLEERSAELSVTQAALSYMERCRKCNCAVELGAAPTVMQVFKCPECKYECCRNCDEPWIKEHEGVSCEQFAKSQNTERILEKRLSEAVVHKCPKCKLAFVKQDGCNKVKCRCGETQCYICRERDIDYSHFCKCFGAKRSGDGAFKCLTCQCSCLLWESSVTLEQRDISRIRREAKEEEERRAKRAANKKEDKQTKCTSASDSASLGNELKRPRRGILRNFNR